MAVRTPLNVPFQGGKPGLGYETPGPGNISEEARLSTTAQSNQTKAQ